MKKEKSHATPATMLSLTELKRVYIVGVCGTLMGAFAYYLKRKGVRVTGSDQHIYPPMSDLLQNAGVELLNGYSSQNLEFTQDRPDLVIIGNVIRADNPEVRAAMDQGYRYSSLPEAMEKLFLAKSRNLVVAGTHGKTTTSSLLAHTLVQCKKDPSYFIGGVSADLPFSFHVSANTDTENLFVLEGDEYDTAFWDKVPKFNHYLPNDVILTSVEYDHADIYPDLAAVVKAFEGLVQRIRPQGRIIACADYAEVRELIKKVSVPVLTYGISAVTSRFTPGNVQLSEDFTQFQVLDQGEVVDQLSIRLPGYHNVLNALAVWIECRELGMDPAQVRGAFRSFQGVRRRQEERGEVAGVLVIDDFAHHPTAVRETLRALRHKYPKRRLITVFEPRSATSRRKVFQRDYAVAFGEADLIWVAKPYDQSRIDAQNQFSSEQLIEDLHQAGKSACLMKNVDSGIQDLAVQVRAGDLVAVLSNGGFDGFIPKLMSLLGRK